MILMIVSGRSGAGKSVALRALEDMGFYCVDNMPLELLEALSHTLKDNKMPVAVSLDIRNMPANLSKLDNIIKTLPAYITPQLLFLDSSRETLIKRYSDTRRAHPLLHKASSLEDAIDLEVNYLMPVRDLADLTITTDALSVHELTDMLRQRILGKKERELNIVIKSFGFKYGIPKQADFIFDARFLPNPHWDLSLRKLTGIDKPVIDFLASKSEVQDFIDKTAQYLLNWITPLKNNNRSYLMIAIGCTGGQHRSVYIAEQIAKQFTDAKIDVKVSHRVLNKTSKKL